MFLQIAEPAAIYKSHRSEEFGGPAAALTAVCANHALDGWLGGDMSARRDYARFLGDRRDLALVDLSGLAHDVKLLISRKAAPTLRRPEQTAVVMWDGRVIDVDAAVWWTIYDLAKSEGNMHWSPSYRRDDDKWTARWAAIRLDGNEYGRLLEDVNA